MREPLKRKEEMAATATTPARGFVQTSRPVRYEDIQRRLGPNTRWHVLIFVIGNLPGLFAPFHNLGSIFTIYTPDHWCSLPVNSAFANDTSAAVLLASNWTVDRVRAMSIPRTETGAFDKCRMYDRPDYDVILSEPWSEERWGNNGTDVGDPTVGLVECQGWTYDRSQMASSIVTELDLVCGAKGLAALAKSAYMIGMFFGSALYGYISDRFGRRKAALSSLTQYLISAFLLSASSNYAVFFLCRLSSGMAAIATFLSGYIVLNETVSPETRGVIQMISSTPFSLGYVIMPMFAYFLRDWKFFNLAGSIISLTMLVYIWTFPESPRWLIQKGRLDEAKVVLQRIAKTNRHTDTTDEELTTMIQQCHDQQEKEKEVDSNRWMVLDLLRTSVMRKNTIICCYLWAAISSGYYGLIYSSPSFGSSPFLINIISGISEFPLAFIGTIVIKYVKRRVVLGGSYLLSGTFCLLYIAAPASLPWLGSTLALSGRFFASLVFTFVYIVTAEIFPTNRRNIAMGVCSSFARIGAVIAPFITEYLGAYNIGYSMTVFGTELIVGGLLCFLLTETGDKTLPETEVDVKNLNELLLMEIPTTVGTSDSKR